MATRRSFLAALAGTGATLPVFREHAIGRVVRATEIAGTRPADALADDEAYWTEIQRAFDVDRTMVNLNNGGCSPAPTQDRKSTRLNSSHVSESRMPSF